MSRIYVRVFLQQVSVVCRVCRVYRVCRYDCTDSFCFLIFPGVNVDSSYHTNNCQFYQAPEEVKKMTDEMVGNMRESAMR